MAERILVVAPSWVGDAILSEPLLALLREPYEEPIVDVLAPPWCAPGVRAHARHPPHHREPVRARRARTARAPAPRRASCAREHYTRAFVLPNSWKSALVPFLARIPRRIGYVGEARWGLLTDARVLDREALPRLVDRYAALAGAPRRADADAACAGARARRRQPRGGDARAAACAPTARSRSCARAPNTARRSAGRRTISPTSARQFLRDGLQVWIVGSPNDKIAANAVLQAAGEPAQRFAT